MARVIAINETWRLAPWADLLYACDEAWWRLRGPYPHEFIGLRYIGKDTFPGCIPCGVTAGTGNLIFDGERLGAGGNSGFQALNLAVMAGAQRIILTGVDLSVSNGIHWHGPHPQGLNNPHEKMLRNCALIFDAQKPVLQAYGVEVINVSPISALKAYPKMTMEEALK